MNNASSSALPNTTIGAVNATGNATGTSTGHRASAGGAMLGLLLLGAATVGMQTAVTWWSRRHPRSYNAVTLAGMWLIPPMLCMADRREYAPFLTVWAVYTAAHGWLIWRATRTPIHHATPRLVYWWYRKSYSLCYLVGALGASMMLADMFGLTAPFLSGDLRLSAATNSTTSDEIRIVRGGRHAWNELASSLAFYGVYFGLLGRDQARALADFMAHSIGYYNKEGLPQRHLRSNICALCGEHVDSLVDNRQFHPSLQHFQLDCRHVFHADCIRGWCLLGKKDVCPYCRERVDMRKFSGTNPWDTQQVLYLQLLDLVRYFLVWLPVSIVALVVGITLISAHG